MGSQQLFSWSEDSTCFIIDLFLNQGSSFKSPALKDVKIQKSNVASFQPSQKARDWSSLEQSLESVFSVQDQQKVSNFINLPPSFFFKY